MYGYFWIIELHLAWKYDYEKIERATLIEWCLRLLPDVAGVEFCL